MSIVDEEIGVARSTMISHPTATPQSMTVVQSLQLMFCRGGSSCCDYLCGISGNNSGKVHSVTSEDTLKPLSVVDSPPSSEWIRWLVAQDSIISTLSLTWYLEVETDNYEDSSSAHSHNPHNSNKHNNNTPTKREFDYFQDFQRYVSPSLSQLTATSLVSPTQVTTVSPEKDIVSDGRQRRRSRVFLVLAIIVLVLLFPLSILYLHAILSPSSSWNEFSLSLGLSYHTQLIFAITYALLTLFLTILSVTILSISDPWLCRMVNKGRQTIEQVTERFTQSFYTISTRKASVSVRPIGSTRGARTRSGSGSSSMSGRSGNHRLQLLLEEEEERAHLFSNHHDSNASNASLNDRESEREKRRESISQVDSEVLPTREGSTMVQGVTDSRSHSLLVHSPSNTFSATANAVAAAVGVATSTLNAPTGRKQTQTQPQQTPKQSSSPSPLKTSSWKERFAFTSSLMSSRRGDAERVSRRSSHTSRRNEHDNKHWLLPVISFLSINGEIIDNYGKPLFVILLQLLALLVLIYLSGGVSASIDSNNGHSYALFAVCMLIFICQCCISLFLPFISCLCALPDLPISYTWSMYGISIATVGVVLPVTLISIIRQHTLPISPVSIIVASVITVFVSFCLSIAMSFDSYCERLRDYAIIRALKHALEEKDRLAEATHAQELRHMIANVAHDLKTVSVCNLLLVDMYCVMTVFPFNSHSLHLSQEWNVFNLPLKTVNINAMIHIV